MNKIKLLRIRFSPSNPSLPVAVPIPGTYKSGQPGWISSWNCEADFELAQVIMPAPQWFKLEVT